MKILFVSQYYSPEPFSNANIVEALIDRDHAVEVLTALPNYPEGVFYPGYQDGRPRVETIGGVRVTRVRTKPRGSTRRSLALNYLSFAFFGSIKAMRHRFERPDVIFLSQLSPVFMALPAIILARRYKVPLVFWVQDIWPESAVYTLNLNEKSLLARGLRRVSAALYRAADVLLVQNAAMPPLIERFGIDPSRIEVFPNTSRDRDAGGGDTDSDRYADLYPNHGFKIVYAGNVGQAQGFDTLVAAAQALKRRGLDAQWIIIGEGRDKARFEEEVGRLGLGDSIRFLGRYPEDAMPCLYKQADAMLLILKSNKVFDLTVPYKLQGYLAAGKPIIGSVDGEAARIIERSGAGVAAPAEDPEALAEAVARMVEDFSSKQAHYQRAARAYFAENYAPDRLFDRLDRILSAAAGRP